MDEESDDATVWAFLRINIQLKVCLRQARLRLKEKKLQELCCAVQRKRCWPWFRTWQRQIFAIQHYRRQLLRRGLRAFESKLNKTDLVVVKLHEGIRQTMCLFLRRTCSRRVDKVYPKY